MKILGKLLCLLGFHDPVLTDTVTPLRCKRCLRKTNIYYHKD